MLVKPSFFSPIYSGEFVQPKERLRFLRFGEAFFDFGQKSYQISDYSASEKYLCLKERISSKLTQRGVVFRLVLIISGVALLILVAKIAYRLANTPRLPTLEGLNSIPPGSQSEEFFKDAFSAFLKSNVSNYNTWVQGSKSHPKLSEIYSKLTPEARVWAETIVRSLGPVGTSATYLREY